MKKSSTAILMAMSILIITAGQVFGLAEFKDGGTHNINSTINDLVWVDYGSPGVRTTVNLVAGGSVDSLYGDQDSRVNISGGNVSYNMIAVSNCRATMSGGTIGTSTSILDANFAAYGNSLITMLGGTVYHDLDISGTSRFEWSGGNVGRNLYVTTTANLTIEGTNFAINGIPVNFGQYYASDFSSGILTGILANSDVINNQFVIRNSASITLVPEPASAVILTFGGLMFILKRKKR
jgi:hypothetical protein